MVKLDPSYSQREIAVDDEGNEITIDVPNVRTAPVASGFQSFMHRPLFSAHQGVAVMEPLLTITTYDADQEHQTIPYQRVTLTSPVPVNAHTKTSSICEACGKWDPDAYLGGAYSGTSLNTTALKFSCLMNITCAWGPLFCETCLNGIYVNQSMPDWFVEK